MNQLVSKTLDRLVAEIDAGRNPWKKSWKGGGGMPVNAVTRNRYRGVNTLLLWLAAEESGWTSMRFASFKQWGGQGRYVRKGEKGTPIIVYRVVDRPDEEGGAYRFARVSWVFNEAQLDGAEAEPQIAQPAPPEQRHAAAMTWFEGAGITLHPGKPAYNWLLDQMTMPAASDFTDLDEYWSTVFHESVHWTGHKSRLGRKLSLLPSDYAFEELVAEIGAAFMNAEFGIDTVENNAAYLRHWLGQVEDKRVAISRAASEASKAFDFLITSQNLAEQAA